jgi:hypothetical protein
VATKTWYLRRHTTFEQPCQTTSRAVITIEPVLHPGPCPPKTGSKKPIPEVSISTSLTSQMDIPATTCQLSRLLDGQRQTGQAHQSTRYQAPGCCADGNSGDRWFLLTAKAPAKRLFFNNGHSHADVVSQPKHFPVTRSYPLPAGRQPGLPDALFYPAEHVCEEHTLLKSPDQTETGLKIETAEAVLQPSPQRSGTRCCLESRAIFASRDKQTFTCWLLSAPLCNLCKTKRLTTNTVFGGHLTIFCMVFAEPGSIRDQTSSCRHAPKPSAAKVQLGCLIRLHLPENRTI